MVIAATGSTVREPQASSTVREPQAAVKLVVNWVQCKGHGRCADLFPERITLDEWRYPIINAAPIPSHLEAHARRAADAAPRSPSV